MEQELLEFMKEEAPADIVDNLNLQEDLELDHQSQDLQFLDLDLDNLELDNLVLDNLDIVEHINQDSKLVELELEPEILPQDKVDMELHLDSVEQQVINQHINKDLELEPEVEQELELELELEQDIHQHIDQEHHTLDNLDNLEVEIHNKVATTNLDKVEIKVHMDVVLETSDYEVYFIYNYIIIIKS